MSASICEVRLLRFPVAVQAVAAEHHEELVREFSYLVHPHPDVMSRPPARLIMVVEELEERFGAFTVGPREQVEQARGEGIESLDLCYAVPVEVGDAAKSFGALLDEVDDYCRSGDLLTLAAPPLIVEFRRWFLAEFARQIEGAEPTPWSGPLVPDQPGDRLG
jgi:hypothetical protein